ncbi:MAG: elongation factor Tu [Methanomassiliicoccales archaeon]|nr:elongation factor Tu [Methanomassiliicoccales archaeon]
MGNLNVAAVGTLGYAKDLGKKGTVSDITIYDLKKGHDTVSILEPSKYPERINSLYFCVNLAELALVVVDEINAALGETLLMLDCANVKRGIFILRNYLTPDRIAPLLKDTVLTNYTYMADDPIILREFLLEEAAKVQNSGEGKGVVPIDHHFNVKGVGTVILGYVAKGVINRHDNLKVLPTERTALVRSIQKHDDDFDVAYKGDRVGLALKNFDAEDLDRGFVLTNDPDMKVISELSGRLDLVKYWQSPIKEGMVVHLGHWMQFLPCRVLSVSGDAKRPQVVLTLEKPLIYCAGSRAVVTYLEGGKLRIVGTMDL